MLKAFVRFGAAGAVATLLHVALASVGFALGLAAAVANVIAFCVCSSASYQINSRWAFVGRAGRYSARRFAAVSATLAVVVWCIAWSCEWLGMPAWQSTAVVVFVMPFIGFAAHHRWTFARPPRPAGSASPTTGRAPEAF